MKTDINLSTPTFSNPTDTQNFGAFTSRLQEILNDISNQNKVKIVTVAPIAGQLEEFFNTSDVVIFHSATQNLRKVYYKHAGTIFLIASA